MKFVIIESPFAGNVAKNKQYAKNCLLDSLERGEAPFASHLLYTQVLNDLVPVERLCGINAGLELAKRADVTAVYFDKGISKGMSMGIRNAIDAGRKVEYRSILLPGKSFKSPIDIQAYGAYNIKHESTLH